MTRIFVLAISFLVVASAPALSQTHSPSHDQTCPHGPGHVPHMPVDSATHAAMHAAMHAFAGGDSLTNAQYATVMHMAHGSCTSTGDSAAVRASEKSPPLRDRVRRDR